MSQQYRRQEGVSLLLINGKRAALTRKRKLDNYGGFRLVWQKNLLWKIIQVVTMVWVSVNALKSASSKGWYTLWGEWSRVVLNRVWWHSTCHSVQVNARGLNTLGACVLEAYYRIFCCEALNEWRRSVKIRASTCDRRALKLSQLTNFFVKVDWKIVYRRGRNNLHTLTIWWC